MRGSAQSRRTPRHFGVYGVAITEPYRQAATRILKGTTPGELPVQAATGFERVLNVKTTKAPGITVPRSMLGRADEVMNRIGLLLLAPNRPTGAA
jgi:hypothetical protein